MEGMDIDDLSETELAILAKCLHGAGITEVVFVLPETITALCGKFGLVKGSAMDLQNGWKFDLSDHRGKATEIIPEEKPILLIGSPPCTYFRVRQKFPKAVHKNNDEGTGSSS